MTLPDPLPTADSPTLTEFLLARIAEDEAEAHNRGDAEWFEGGWTLDHEARVLADCEAKRRIVEWSDEHLERWKADEVLGRLASVYADHPDYRAEWKP